MEEVFNSKTSTSLKIKFQAKVLQVRQATEVHSLFLLCWAPLRHLRMSFTPAPMTGVGAHGVNSRGVPFSSMHKQDHLRNKNIKIRTNPEVFRGTLSWKKVFRVTYVVNATLQTSWILGLIVELLQDSGQKKFFIWNPLQM